MTDKPVKYEAKKIIAEMQSKEISQLESFLEQYKIKIAQVLPKHLNPERIIQIAISSIETNPELKDCDINSLLGAVIQTSILGFKPVNALGLCYFVPYKVNKGTKDKPNWIKVCQLQIGYKGFIDLCRRSGIIQTIYAEVVRKGDEFDYTLGLNPTLTHKPKLDNTEPITHAYAVAKYVNGGFNFVVLTINQIEGLRKRNKMQGEELTGAWKTDYEAMCKAKAIKQLSKWLPLSIDLQEQILTDEAIITTDNFDQEGKIKAEKIKYDLDDNEEITEIAPFLKEDNDIKENVNINKENKTNLF